MPLLFIHVLRGDAKSVYLKLESGIDLKPHINKTYVDAFKHQIFNQDGNESPLLRIKCYNPPDLVFQPLPVKDKVKNIEVNRMRNG